MVTLSLVITGWGGKSATCSLSVTTLATCDGNLVAVRQGNQLALAFHPELDEDPRIHQLFLDL